MIVSIRHTDIIMSLIWFTSLIFINLSTSEPTKFILAYATPVIVVTCKRNMQWGFLVSAVGALTAVLSGAITGSLQSNVSVAEEGLFSFAQLSAISMGITLGKRSHRKRNKLKGTKLKI